MFDLPKQVSDFRFQTAEGRVPLAQSPATACLRARRGVTLIELLIVISIMMMLAAYALPKLAPMARERKIREAARSVSVFLSRARSRAIETGRPCGVVFQRFDTDTNNPLSNAATMLYQAEVPPPYAGDTTSARVTMTGTSSPFTATLVTGIQPKLLRRGDRMQINGQGPWYTIIAPDTHDVDGNPIDNDGDGTLDGDGIIDGSDPTDPTSAIGSLDLSIDLHYHNPPPWPLTAQLPFKILRQPVRTIAQPLSLPVGTAVDLSTSGTDADDQGRMFGSGQGDVTIMFSPNGSVSGYYYKDVDGFHRERDATAPIFLLVGWREQIGRGPTAAFPRPGIHPKPFDPDNPPDVDEEELPNWQILSNLWVGLNSQSGLVTVAENAFPEDTYKKAQAGDLNDAEWRLAGLIEARQYARRAQSKGGR